LTGCLADGFLTGFLGGGVGFLTGFLGGGVGFLVTLPLTAFPFPFGFSYVS
jgi:hypothetical protein